MGAAAVESRAGPFALDRRPGVLVAQDVKPGGDRPAGVGRGERLTRGGPERAEDIAVAAPATVDFRCAAVGASRTTRRPERWRVARAGDDDRAGLGHCGERSATAPGFDRAGRAGDVGARGPSPCPASHAPPAGVVWHLALPRAEPFRRDSGQRA